MKAGCHFMSEARPQASATIQLVQIEVSPTHPLLLLKRALPWEAITEVMTRHWRQSQSGKNVDGGPGFPWDVSLYVPLVVLMVIKGFDSRQMEAYVAENVVARVFIGRSHDAKAQIRDHSNIARAYAVLGKEGIDAVNQMVIQEAHAMAAVRYSNVQSRPTEFLDLTSLTPDEFEQLIPPFEVAFQAHMAQWRLDGKPRTARQFTVYKNCPLPPPQDRLFFLLTDLKTDSLQVVQGRLFGMSQSKANKWIHVVLPA